RAVRTRSGDVIPDFARHSRRPKRVQFRRLGTSDVLQLQTLRERRELAAPLAKRERRAGTTGPPVFMPKSGGVAMRAGVGPTRPDLRGQGSFERVSRRSRPREPRAKMTHS